MTFDGGAAGGRRSAARTQTTPATSGIHHPAPGAPSLSVGLAICDTVYQEQTWEVLGWDDDEVRLWRPVDQERRTLTRAQWDTAWRKGWLMLDA